MLPQRLIETLVGMFLLLALMAMTILAFKVSGLTTFFPPKSYIVSAEFDEIGGLKVRSPVKIGGVQIGEVEAINLDAASFKANVKMKIYHQFNEIPDDSSAGIFTAGLLGDNYIAITPMYNTTFLKDGSVLEYTNSAMILEKLIGQFIYKMGGDDKKGDDKKVTNEKNLTSDKKI